MAKEIRFDQEARQKQGETPGDDPAGTTVRGLAPGHHRDREHAQRQRSECQTSLQRGVFQHHLQVDGQGDHRASERYLLQHLSRDAQPELRWPEQRWVHQRGPPGG